MKELPPLEFQNAMPRAFKTKALIACLALPLMCIGAIWLGLTSDDSLRHQVKAAIMVPLAIALLLALSVALPKVVWRMLTNPVLLRIDTQGLTTPSLGLIPWEDVGPYQLKPRSGMAVASKTGERRENAELRLQILNPARYRARLAWYDRLNWAEALTFGRSHLIFNDVFLSQPAAMIAAGIEAHRALQRV